MRSRFSLSRRQFLRGAGGAILALPTLDAMLNGNGTAYAQGQPLPKRFGVFFWGDGVRLDRWVPSATGAGWSPSASLVPLAPVQSYVNVISGYSVREPGSRGHHNGSAAILSGVPYIELPHNAGSYSSKFGGPSIDQILASELHPDKPVLCLGVSKRAVGSEGPTLQFTSHRGPDQPIAPRTNPIDVYNVLFGGFQAPPGEPDPRAALRVSVLDLVNDDINRLKSRLGAGDRQRLDAHLTGVSELRSRLQQEAPEVSGNCQLPAQPTDSNDGNNLRRITDIYGDLIAMAFACDLVRGVNVQFTGAIAFDVFPGTSNTHHDLSHDANLQEQVQQTTVYTMESFSSLLQKLKNTPEGAGNVLDNSLFLATSDCCEGLSHGTWDYPVLLAGGAGGAMRTPGVHRRSNGGNTNDVLMTILRAMGSSRSSIGTGGMTSSTVISEVLA